MGKSLANSSSHLFLFSTPSFSLRCSTPSSTRLCWSTTCMETRSWMCALWRAICTGFTTPGFSTTGWAWRRSSGYEDVQSVMNRPNHPAPAPGYYLGNVAQGAALGGSSTNNGPLNLLEVCQAPSATWRSSFSHSSPHRLEQTLLPLHMCFTTMLLLVGTFQTLPTLLTSPPLLRSLQSTFPIFADLPVFSSIRS